MHEELIQKLRSIFPNDIIISCQYEEKEVLKNLDRQHITLTLQVNADGIRVIAAKLQAWLRNKNNGNGIIDNTIKLGKTANSNIFYLYVSKLEQIDVLKITSDEISDISKQIQLSLNSEGQKNGSREAAAAMMKKQCYEQLRKVLYQPSRFANDFRLDFDTNGEGIMALEWRREANGNLILTRLFNFLEGKFDQIDEESEATIRQGEFCTLTDNPLLDTHVQIQIILKQKLRSILLDNSWKDSVSEFHTGITRALELIESLKAEIAKLSQLRLTDTSILLQVPPLKPSIEQANPDSNAADVGKADEQLPAQPSSFFEQSGPSDRTSRGAVSAETSKAETASKLTCSIQ